MNSFPAQLTRWMQARNMDQVELAKRSAISQSVVSLYLAGKRSPTLESLLRLCRALQITPNELLGVPDRQQLSEESLRVWKAFLLLPPNDPIRVSMLAMIKAKFGIDLSEEESHV